MARKTKQTAGATIGLKLVGKASIAGISYPAGATLAHVTLTSPHLTQSGLDKVIARGLVRCADLGGEPAAAAVESAPTGDAAGEATDDAADDLGELAGE